MIKVGKHFFVSDTETSWKIQELEKLGQLRMVCKGLYTDDIKKPLEKLCRDNMWDLVSHFLPGSLLSDRTAFDGRATQDGIIFVAHTRTRPLLFLPGLKIFPRNANILESDNDFLNGLKISSFSRILLDNLKPSRNREGVSRTVGQAEVEKRLEALVAQKGNTECLLEIRQEARVIASELGLENEFKILNGIIGAFRGTAPAKATTETVPSVVARLSGVPYDEQRIGLFETVIDTFRKTAPHIQLSKIQADTEAWKNLSFYDAYFSNFIEGTEFEVDEAMRVVYDGLVPDFRKADAHDIKATFDISSNIEYMQKSKLDFDEFLENLKGQHAHIMARREDIKPGELKDKLNRAGNHHFIEPNLVLGTLKKAHSMMEYIEGSFEHALFLHIMLADIHPFLDGNGRISRIAMNAELQGSGLARIIIPTGFRNDYLDGLRAVTSGNGVHTFVSVMKWAQRWTSVMPWENETAVRILLEKSNAFSRDKEDRLTIPTNVEIETTIEECQESGHHP